MHITGRGIAKPYFVRSDQFAFGGTATEYLSGPGLNV